MVATREMRRENLILKINASTVTRDMREGDSVAVNGVCLTVTSVERDGFRVEASSRTVSVSTIGNWQAGQRINLERALQAGDRLGGHIVQGHVDGQGKVVRVQYSEGSTNIHIGVPDSMLKLMAPRGSVAVDGVSLTLADKTSRGFKVVVIPWTLEHTILGELKPGDPVNIETDLIIRWLADRFPDGDVASDAETNWAGFGDFHLED